MAEDVLILCENVSKRFCRELKQSLWYGVKDIAHEVAFNRQRHLPQNAAEVELRPGEFWANKDISFEVKRGECLGLIGRNGAGKTTLLKMLNGLIKPDTGRIDMRGKISALIALGAGFNPILTGRENIFVNGSILGMSKRQIADRLEEIVDFAELEEFIDTPVRNYSSGMQVRLGFAISAVMIKPDVLLLDEVLAVGDAGFRSKCYNALLDLARDSALVIISHSMPQIARMSTQVIVLEKGAVAAHSHLAAEGINSYFLQFEPPEALKSWSEAAEVISISAGENSVCGDGTVLVLNRQQSRYVDLELKVSDTIESLLLILTFYNREQRGVLRTDCLVATRVTGRCMVRIHLNELPLTPGSYQLHLMVCDSADPRRPRHLARYDPFCGVSVESENQLDHTVTCPVSQQATGEILNVLR
ncbi:ABC transporter ATP-binding protein [Blastopirellula marina]|uniref:Polysialic acid transport ATP-binding protein KpsT n=1 Tax=Blastopirellula marina DSM 3645 TaxID=314230 RepID=A3ZPE4_9BACT|nr:ABC transporter ATP-binding protein [Blastopirellula marina]EAQ81622.1 polysialic acid transport ATP-binding protein; KpsT [Blastopirellula marina DSM 3645]